MPGRWPPWQRSTRRTPRGCPGPGSSARTTPESLLGAALGATGILLDIVDGRTALRLEVGGELVEAFLLDLGVDLVAVVRDVRDALDDHVIRLPVAAGAL